MLLTNPTVWMGHREKKIFLIKSHSFQSCFRQRDFMESKDRRGVFTRTWILCSGFIIISSTHILLSNNSISSQKFFFFSGANISNFAKQFSRQNFVSSIHKGKHHLSLRRDEKALILWSLHSALLPMSSQEIISLWYSVSDCLLYASCALFRLKHYNREVFMLFLFHNDDSVVHLMSFKYRTLSLIALKFMCLFNALGPV